MKSSHEYKIEEMLDSLVRVDDKAYEDPKEAIWLLTDAVRDLIKEVYRKEG